MSKKWSNLAKVVYKRTYARGDSGTPENWGKTIDRVIEGNLGKYRGTNVLEKNEEEKLRNLMINRKATPAGRGLWFSGAPAHSRIGGAALNNCFSGETRFFADGRLQSLKSLAGQTVSVICADGESRPALVSEFGTQSLNKISMGVDTRSNISITFHATANHRWLTERGETSDLMVGDRITVTPRVPQIESQDFKDGFIHGLFFGDGTRHTQYHQRFIIRLCGAKIKYLSQLESHSGYISTVQHESSKFEPIVTIKNSVNLKQIPDEGTSWDYQGGFAQGWLAADGSSRGRLTSTNHSSIDWLKERAPMLGFTVRGDLIDSNECTNFGPRKNRVRVLTLSPEPVSYRIKAIETSGRSEPVYCVTEPITKTFTLEYGITTGNCWFVTSEEWINFVIGMDLLMLGGGVGMSIEHRFVSKLPKIKKGVIIQHKPTKDADFIIPDSREGWCELLHRTLESFFVTGKSFTYSTVCVRGYGEKITGFGGTASGPLPLVKFIENISAILINREGRHIRPIDAMDLLCATGEMVVAGNVRRSAIIILGDAFDKEYLTSKRWDLGPIPSYRSSANLSVVIDDIEDVHKLFWKTYENGEPFGIVNRKNIQMYGRMGEKKKDTAVGVNPCAEATLENFEPCNLQEISLTNLDSVEEFVEASRLMHRYGKRVTLEKYHHPQIQEVINRNRRVGTGITGCLQRPDLFNPAVLDQAYAAIATENKAYSKLLGINESVRTTVIKPSGTMSKVMDCFEGVHPAYSRYMIQRVRFASNDALIPLLKEAGHYMEPTQRFDGSLDHGTQVVDFFIQTPDGIPVADEDWNTWKQLDVVKMAQKHWADQSVSVTVYYKKEDILNLKEWLQENMKYIKTISFLCHSDHGFKQAPKEAITKEQFEKLSATIKELDVDRIGVGGELQDTECEGGVCPVK